MRHKVLVESFTRLSLTSQQHSLRNGILRYYSTPVQDAKPFKSIPGLSSLPVVGSLHHFLPVIGDFGPQGNFFKMAEVLHKKYGPLAKVSGMLFRSDMVMLFDPGHIEQVLRAQEANPLRNGFETLKYYRENYRKDKFERTYALSTAQGAEWREFRTKVNPALLKLKLVKVYAPPLEEIAQDFVARLKRLNDGTNYLTDNFLSEANRWSLESIAFVGFGARLGCLRDDLTPDHPASKLMKCAQDFLHLSYQLEYLPNPWRFVTTPAFKKIMQTFETQWQVSTMYIEQARNRIKDRGYEIPEEDQSIIERLLTIDERVAVMMANEMLFAGIDTVGFTITSMLYELANNPLKQEKLREEIRSGDSRRRYLKACLKEATRLWPVTPVTLRTTDRDHYVGGFHIPSGVDILVPNEFLSRQEKYYPSPNEFIPERWLVDKTDPLYYGNAHPMVTLPFGFGIRSCIGRRIAELEIEMLFKNLIDEFKVTWEGPPIKVVNTILNSFEKPFNFKFVNAK